MRDPVEALIARTYQLARHAVACGNHPFGALLVKDGDVVLEAENAVVTTRDVTRHAETALVAKATIELDRATLASSTLVTSTEPCIMCCGAIHWAGIGAVHFGVRSERMVATFGGSYRGIPCREVFSRLNPDIEIRGPFIEGEGLEIHAEFWPDFLSR